MVIFHGLLFYIRQYYIKYILLQLIILIFNHTQHPCKHDTAVHRQSNRGTSGSPPVVCTSVMSDHWWQISGTSGPPVGCCRLANSGEPLVAHWQPSDNLPPEACQQRTDEQNSDGPPVVYSGGLLMVCLLGFIESVIIGNTRFYQ